MNLRVPRFLPGSGYRPHCLLKISSHDLMCMQTVEVCIDSDSAGMGRGVRLHPSTQISGEHCAAAHPKTAVFSGCQSALVGETRRGTAVQGQAQH